MTAADLSCPAGNLMGGAHRLAGDATPYCHVDPGVAPERLIDPLHQQQTHQRFSTAVIHLQCRLPQRRHSCGLDAPPGHSDPCATGCVSPF